jgi:hypothetical protein
VALSPTLRGRLHAADAAGEPDELADLAQRFRIGQPLRCRVLQVGAHTGLKLACILWHHHLGLVTPGGKQEPSRRRSCHNMMHAGYHRVPRSSHPLD